MEKQEITTATNTNRAKGILWKTVIGGLVLASLTGLSVYRVIQGEQKRKAQLKENAAKWKTQAVTTPQAGALKAAGYVTITWNDANALGDVSGYKVYVDDELVTETDAETTTCEYYTTKVRAHEVYVETDLANGAQIYSDIFTFYVNKKGFCVNKDMAQSLNATDWGASWYYNWDMNAFKYTSFQELEYVPMLWSNYDTNEKIISRFSKQGYKYVLAFNEPDRTDQAALDVDEAVESMKAFYNQNLIIGSPATALCPPWSKQWFQPFMQKMEAEGMDVDFIAIHHYWNWWQDEGADAFVDLVKETYEMYHKPIWITEFAISGDPGQNEEQRNSVITYMQRALPQLDELDYVERYAWFSFNPHDKRNGASGMYRYHEGTITDLGYVYQKLGMPEGCGDANVALVKENSRQDVME